MARPVNADPAETRSRVLAAAARLFAQRGRDAVSMRTIAGAAGTTAATLHHYFGNKDALYDACVDAMYARVREIGAQVALTLTQTDAFTEIIAAGICAAYGAARAHQDAVRLMSRHVLDHGEAAAPRRTDAVNRFLSLADPFVARISPLSPGERRGMLYSFMLLFNRAVLLEPTEVSLVWPDGDVEGALVGAFTRMLAVQVD